jgi:hypothetical protein
MLQFGNKKARMILVTVAMVLCVGVLLSGSATPAYASVCAYWIELARQWEIAARCWKENFRKADVFHAEAQVTIQEAGEHEARIYAELITTIEWWNNTYVPTMNQIYDSGTVVWPKFLSQQELERVIIAPPALPNGANAEQQRSIELLEEATARMTANAQWIAQMKRYLTKSDLSDAWQITSMAQALVLRQVQLRHEIDQAGIAMAAQIASDRAGASRARAQ